MKSVNITVVKQALAVAVVTAFASFLEDKTLLD